MTSSFKNLEAFPSGSIDVFVEDFSTETISDFFRIDATPENFDSLVQNPAFDFWNDPSEDIYEDA